MIGGSGVYLRYDGGAFYIGETRFLRGRYPLRVIDTILAWFPEPVERTRLDREKEFIQFAHAMGVPLSNREFITTHSTKGKHNNG